MNDINIHGISNGFVVTTPDLFSSKEESVPTLGQALARIVYRALRREGDTPYPHNKIEGEDKYWESETLQTITTFLKTLGPKAVEQALKENLAEAEEDAKKETPTQ